MRLPTMTARRAPSVAGKAGPPANKRRPPLAYVTEQAPNPIDNVTAPDTDIEGQTTEALDEIQKAFRAAEAKQLEIYDYAPIGFFRVLVFQTCEQAAEFSKAIGQDPEMQYVDGRKIADTLGIEIPADNWTPKKGLMAPNRRLAALAKPLPRKA